VVSAFARFLESPGQERLELFLSDEGGWLFVLPFSGLLALGVFLLLQTTGRITVDTRTGAAKVTSSGFRGPSLEVVFNLDEVGTFETEAVEDTEFRALVMERAGERSWLLTGGDSDTYAACDALRRALTAYRARRKASSS
jgi:hypothetical protein